MYCCVKRYHKNFRKNPPKFAHELGMFSKESSYR